MPRKPANLDGQRFGRLVVLGITEQRNNQGRALYRCRCDCGRERLAPAGELRRGKITNCGDGIHRVKDISGQRFGRLVALHPTRVPDGARSTYNWLCQCDCGKTVEVNVNSLTCGKTISCGCAQKDFAKSLYEDGTAPCKLTESKKPRRTNKSGVTGVWYDSRRNKWCAEIMLRRKKIFLGRYENKEDAIKARHIAEEKYFQPIIDNY